MAEVDVSNLKFKWAVSYGGNKFDTTSALQYDASSQRLFAGGEFASATAAFGSYTETISGSTSGDTDAWVAELDPDNGSVKWVMAVGSATTQYSKGDEIEGVAFGGGNLYIAGATL